MVAHTLWFQHLGNKDMKYKVTLNHIMSELPVMATTYAKCYVYKMYIVNSLTMSLLLQLCLTYWCKWKELSVVT